MSGGGVSVRMRQPYTPAFVARRPMARASVGAVRASVGGPSEMASRITLAGFIALVPTAGAYVLFGATGALVVGAIAFVAVSPILFGDFTAP